MTIISHSRPEFVPGHVLGHDDLQLLLHYLRDADRRLRLGHRTAGIVAGLRLLSDVDFLGQTSWRIEPGIAVDGYGRMILALNAIEIDAVSLAGLPPGPTQVWIGYSEEPRRGYRDGFEVCDIDAFSRVDEGVELFFGRRDALEARRDSVIVDDLEISDARVARAELGEPNAPTICDGSIGYQDFPDPADGKRWLMLLGNIGWNGVSFAELDQMFDQPQISRGMRQFSGVVTEDILAHDGLVRIRRRESRAPAPGETVEEICAEARPVPSDFVEDPLIPGSFIPDDLMWIEGNTRALGDVRLWGTELSFRNSDGSQTTSNNQFVPLSMRRSPGDGLTPDTQDIQVTLGEVAQNDVANRVVFGRRAPDDSLTITAAITGLGRMGLGTGDPGRYLPEANSLVIEGDGEAGMTIRGSTAGNIHFAQGDAEAAQTRGRIRYDQGTDAMSFTTGGQDRVWIDSGGRVGLGIEDPGVAASAADDFVVFREGLAGITILSGADAADAVSNNWSGRLNFGRGETGGDADVGGITYAHGNDQMTFRTASSTRVTINDDGHMGVGETNPRTRLHVDGGEPLSDLTADAGSVTIGSTSDDHLKLGETGLQALDGPSSDTQLQLQPFGGGLRVHGQEPQSERVTITDIGRLGLGTDAPRSRVEVRGAIRMGDVGDQFALAGLAGELVVRGTVSSSGAAQTGAGYFIESISGNDEINVRFTTAFSATPTIVATSHDDAADNLVTILNRASTGFTVRLVDLGQFINASGSPNDPPDSANERDSFSFIAIGPSTLLS